MSLLLLGVNHKTAPIELREKVAFAREQLADTARSLLEVAGVREAMILSTCNRVEMLAVVDSIEVDIAAFLERNRSIDRQSLRPHLYQYRDAEAVRHLFRVAASLDSMVVGEPQILGQVKEAYSIAREAGTVSTQLDPLLQSAFAAAKKVRSETEIGSSSVSIASVAVDLAKRIFGSLQGKAVFLVGAGKMSELAARHLIQHGAGTILVTNRTQPRAVEMASHFLGATSPRVIPWTEMRQAASQADIIITSTGAPEPIFRPADGQAFLHRRKNRPMFFIDIAVPRDVDPELNRLEGIFLYDIDDLQSVASSHLAERSREAADAESVITQEVDRYSRKLLTLNVTPLIATLQRQAEEQRQAELRRAQQRMGDLSSNQLSAMESFSRSLMNKFLHPPMQALKLAARRGDLAGIEAIRESYGLPDPISSPTSSVAPEPLIESEEDALYDLEKGRS